MTAARSTRSRTPKPARVAPLAQETVIIDDPELEEGLRDALAELDQDRAEGKLVSLDEAMAEIRAELGLPAA